MLGPWTRLVTFAGVSPPDAPAAPPRSPCQPPFVRDLPLPAGGNFALRLPPCGWNGKLAVVGLAQSSDDARELEFAGLLVRGYAVAAMGADEPATQAIGAAARAWLITAFGRYRYSVLLGHAQSGGLALRVATLFPEEFRGVIASAAGGSAAAFADRQSQLRGTLLDRTGTPRISEAQLRALQHAAVSRFDAVDGVADGLIADPFACAADPAEVLKAGSEALAAARNMYRDGALAGSELGWNHAAAKAGHVKTAPQIAAAAQPIDLRAFANVGGKLLLVHGYNAVTIPPIESVRVLNSIEANAGGAVKAAGFARLFLIPGRDDSLGAAQQPQADLIGALERWFERVPPRPPDDLAIAYPRANNLTPATLFAPPEPAAEDVAFSRALFAYPLRTLFKRRGDPNFWRSFYAPAIYRRSTEPVATSELPQPLPQDATHKDALHTDAGLGPVLVAGATGRLGLKLVAELRSRGVAVIALVRDAERAKKLLPVDVTTVVGDVRDASSLARAMQGARKLVFAASATAGGAGDNTPEAVEYGGIRNCIAAAKPAGIDHVILISSASVTQREHMHNLWGDILLWKFRSEELLRHSGLNYTVLRPLGLRPFPGGQRGIRFVQGDRIALGEEISRDDVALLIVALLGNPDALGKTFETYNDDSLPPGSWVGTFGEIARDLR